MKTEDFERLKAVCEKEGFELEISDPWDQTYKISKKDIWQGVEFAEAKWDVADLNNSLLKKGGIYKVIEINAPCLSFYLKGEIREHNLSTFKPSTESAYIEQLKKEAHERFGEIKEGDRFDRSGIKELWGVGEIEFHYHFVGFLYDKDSDRLFFNNLCIYESGKWATRVKEMVKITPLNTTTEKRNNDWKIDFSFSANNRNFSLNGASTFLASQLEKYLNGEIE